MADGVPVSTHSTLGHSSTCVTCVTCEVKEDEVWLMVFLFPSAVPWVTPAPVLTAFFTLRLVSTQQ